LEPLGSLAFAPHAGDHTEGGAGVERFGRPDHPRPNGAVLAASGWPAPFGSDESERGTGTGVLGRGIDGAIGEAVGKAVGGGFERRMEGLAVGMGATDLRTGMIHKDGFPGRPMRPAVPGRAEAGKAAGG
jgi:hypothetical protein